VVSKATRGRRQRRGRGASNIERGDILNDGHNEKNGEESMVKQVEVLIRSTSPSSVGSGASNTVKKDRIDVNDDSKKTNTNESDSTIGGNLSHVA